MCTVLNPHLRHTIEKTSLSVNRELDAQRRSVRIESHKGSRWHSVSIKSAGYNKSYLLGYRRDFYFPRLNMPGPRAEI